MVEGSSSPSSLKKKVASLLATFFFVCASLFGVSFTPAHAGYNSAHDIPEDVWNNVVVPMYEYMIRDGFTKEAAVAILGNANQESTFVPGVAEYGGGGGIGLFQWTGARNTAFMSFMQSEAGGDLSNIDKQMEYMLYKEAEVFGEPGWNVPAYYGDYYLHTYCDPVGSDVDCSKIPYLEPGVENFKKLDDPKLGAIYFQAVWERSATGYHHSIARVTIADSFLERLEGITVEGSNPSSGSSSESKSSGTINVQGSIGIPDESELLGMPQEVVFPSGQPVENKSISDLSAQDAYAVTQVGENIEFSRTPLSTTIAQGIGFIGLLVFVYGVIFFMGGMFDRSSNSIVSVTKFLTFGRFSFAHSSEEEKQTPDSLSLGSIAKRSIIIVTTGLFMVSGSTFGLFAWAISLIQDKLP